MIRLGRGERGQIAPLVAVITAVLVLLTTTVLVLAAGQKQAGVFYGDRIQAYYTAEDGVEEILAAVFNDWEALARVPPGSECGLIFERGTPGGSLRVEGCRRVLSDDGAVELRLETTGTHRNAVRHLLFEAILYPPEDYGAEDVDEDGDGGPDAAAPESGPRLDVQYWGDMYHFIYGWMGG